MKKVCIPDYINSTFFDGNAILLDQNNNTYYALNDSAAEFWKALAQLGSLDAAVKEVSKFYGVPESEVEEDIKNLIQTLIQKGILKDFSP